MYWSSNGPEKTVELVKSADFDIMFARSVETQTPTESEMHFWILARSKRFYLLSSSSHLS
jgi:hypothetical protein